MGYYINHDSKGKALSPTNKAEQLIADGAKRVNINVTGFTENLVCVVENGIFDAAGYIFNSDELNAFKSPTDPRPKTWLVYEHAKKLSGYEG